MDIPTIPEMDRYVSREQAAMLLGVQEEYIAQLCKGGHLAAHMIVTRPKDRYWIDRRGNRHLKRNVGGRRTWINIDVFSLLLYAAYRHSTTSRNGVRMIAAPEEIVARLHLPLRCPRCELLVDTPGPCRYCREEAAGLPYWTRRRDAVVIDTMAGRLMEAA